MSPQPSNRAALLEGAIRCIEALPPERVTARAIADESGANLGSIAYHFGSKDELVTTAVIEGMDRWLEEVDRRLGGPAEGAGRAQFARAAEAIAATRDSHVGLARAFLGALARAQHDERVRAELAEGFRRTRPRLAALLGLGGDQVADDAGGLVMAQFSGLLFQALLDPELAVDGERLMAAQERLAGALSDG